MVEVKVEFDYGDLVAIVDTGCTRTMCGERKIGRIVASVRREEIWKIKERRKVKRNIFW